jgi:tricorn protease-like protein
MVGKPRFSSDGVWIAYGLGGFRKTAEIYVVAADGGEPTRLETGLPWSTSPVWSPDGEHLLVVGSTDPMGEAHVGWYVVPATRGKTVRTRQAKRLIIGGQPFAWCSDNDIVFSRGANVWRVALAPGSFELRGEPHRLTAGTGEYWPSVTTDGRFAFGDVTTSEHLWSLALDADGAEVQGDPAPFTHGGAREAFPTVSRDGQKLVYKSNRSGSMDIWLRDLASGEERQITVSTKRDHRGIISPDGSKVAIHRVDEPRSWSVLLHDLDTGAEKKLIHGQRMSIFDWTPDSRRILYSLPSPFRFYTVDIETLETSLVLAHPELGVDDARFSPDGAGFLSFSCSLRENPRRISRRLRTELPRLRSAGYG